MSAGVRFPFPQGADQRQAVAFRQHPVDHQHVVVAGVGEGQTFLAIAGQISNVTDLPERLDQIVSGLAVIFDDQKAHLGVGYGQVKSAFHHHGAVGLLMQGDPTVPPLS